MPAITQFVVDHMDERFIMPPLFDLPSIFEDAGDPWVPLIFILSSGADPRAALNKFAEERGMTKKMEALSLGQGMGDRAAELIRVCPPCLLPPGTWTHCDLLLWPAMGLQGH